MRRAGVKPEKSPPPPRPIAGTAGAGAGARARRARRGRTAGAGDLRRGNGRGTGILGGGATTGVGSAFCAGAPCGFFIAGRGAGSGGGWIGGGGGGGSAISMVVSRSTALRTMRTLRPERMTKASATWTATTAAIALASIRPVEQFRDSSTSRLRLRGDNACRAEGLAGVERLRFGGEVGVLPLRAERGPDRDHDRGDAARPARARARNCRRAPRRSRPGSARFCDAMRLPSW